METHYNAIGRSLARFQPFFPREDHSTTPIRKQAWYNVGTQFQLTAVGVFVFFQIMGAVLLIFRSFL